MQIFGLKLPTVEQALYRPGLDPCLERISKLAIASIAATSTFALFVFSAKSVAPCAITASLIAWLYPLCISCKTTQPEPPVLPSSDLPITNLEPSNALVPKERVPPDTFPLEVWENILQFLSPSDLLKCLKVNKELRILAQRVIRKYFAAPTQALPWENENVKWGGTCNELARYIDSSRQRDPKLWSKIATFLTRSNHPYDNWMSAINNMTPLLSLKEDDDYEVRAEFYFNVLKHLAELNTPFTEKKYREISVHILDHMAMIQESLSPSFQRKVILFLARQNWKYREIWSRSCCTKNFLVNFFNRYLVLNHVLHNDDVKRLFSFDESLELLHALSKIIDFDGPTIAAVVVIVGCVLDKIASEPDSLTVQILSDVTSSLKKMGKRWSFVSRLKNGFEGLTRWALIHNEDFTKEQIFEFLSLGFSNNLELTKQTLDVFLRRLEDIDQETPLSIEEGATFVTSFNGVDLPAIYDPEWIEFPADLPFFPKFYEREKAKLKKLTQESLSELPFQTMAHWIALFCHLRVIRNASEKILDLRLSVELYITSMGWDGKFTPEQISDLLPRWV